MASTRMTAHVIEEYGDPDVFEEASREVPEPTADEVRVEVAASSLNPVDYKIRRGDLPDFAPDFPATLHCDVAGVVDEVGDHVDRFEVGDEVYGMPGGAGRQGALADYVVGHAGTFAHAPDRLDLEEAAALPVVGLTAWELLSEATTVETGDECLVYGGAGGVGHVAVQLADHWGAEVTATGSTDGKRALAEELGADETVDYTETDVESYTETHASGDGFDVVVDTVGNDHLETAFEAAERHGTVLTTEATSTQDLSPLQVNSLRLGGVLVIQPVLSGRGQERIGEQLEKLGRLVEEGAVSPHVEERFAFEEVADAHRLGESGDFRGKLLLVNE